MDISLNTNILHTIIKNADEFNINKEQLGEISKELIVNHATSTEANILNKLIDSMDKDQLLVFIKNLNEYKQENGASSDSINKKISDILPLLDESVFNKKVESYIKANMKEQKFIESEIFHNVSKKISDLVKIFAYTFAFLILVPGAYFSFFGLTKYGEFVQTIENGKSRIESASATNEQEFKSKTESILTKFTEEIAQLRAKANNVDKELSGKKYADSLSASIIRSKYNINGRIAASYETGNLNTEKSGFFVKMDGEFHYGPWALNKDDAKALVNSDTFPWREDFKDLLPNTPRFNDAWSQLGRGENTDKFLTSQRNFIIDSSLVPALAAIENSSLADLQYIDDIAREYILNISRNSANRFGDLAIEASKKRGKLPPIRDGKELIITLYDTAKIFFPSLAKQYEQNKEDAIKSYRK